MRMIRVLCMPQLLGPLSSLGLPFALFVTCCNVCKVGWLAAFTLAYACLGLKELNSNGADSITSPILRTNQPMFLELVHLSCELDSTSFINTDPSSFVGIFLFAFL